MVNRTAVGLCIMSLCVLLAFSASVNAATMEDSRAYFSFEEKGSGTGQVQAGEIYVTAGVNTATVNVGATATATGQATNGAIGALDPDGKGVGFWAGGSINFGTGASNEFNLAGASGMSIVWRLNGTSLNNVRWGDHKYILAASYNTTDQYRISFGASGSNGVLVYTNISGVGTAGWTIDMSDFNMLQWVTYALTYDGATGNVTLSAWGNDGDFYTNTLAKTAGTIGNVGGNPTLRMGANASTATGIAGAVVDGFAIFDKALTKTEIENLSIPEPGSMAVCLIGGGLMMLRNRKR